LELITAENLGTPEVTLRRYLAALRELPGQLGDRCPQLSVGVYETGAALRSAIEFLRHHAPADLSWTLMPAHGARAVVGALEALDLSADDWSRIGVRTWAEFDGLMYCQQNSLTGTHHLLSLATARLGQAPVPAVMFNHWRTAENRTAIGYAAAA
jgi:hypothetical protein